MATLKTATTTTTTTTTNRNLSAGGVTHNQPQGLIASDKEGQTTQQTDRQTRQTLGVGWGGVGAS